MQYANNYIFVIIVLKSCSFFKLTSNLHLNCRAFVCMALLLPLSVFIERFIYTQGCFSFVYCLITVHCLYSN